MYRWSVKATVAMMALAIAGAGAHAALAAPSGAVELERVVLGALPAGSSDFAPDSVPGSSLANGPIESLDGTPDPVTGLSLKFEAPGYQRYWVNRHTGEVRGVVAYLLPTRVKAAAFMKDWRDSAQVNNAPVSRSTAVAEGLSATFVLGRQPIHEVAFVVDGIGFVAVSARSEAAIAEQVANAQLQVLRPTEQASPAATVLSATAQPSRVPTFLRTWVMLSAVGLMLVAGLHMLERLGLATPIVAPSPIRRRVAGARR